jgi:hypothetical protein
MTYVHPGPCLCPRAHFPSCPGPDSAAPAVPHPAPDPYWHSCPYGSLTRTRPHRPPHPACRVRGWLPAAAAVATFAAWARGASAAAAACRKQHHHSRSHPGASSCPILSLTTCTRSSRCIRWGSRGAFHGDRCTEGWYCSVGGDDRRRAGRSRSCALA